jgi:hypothetical protein
LSWSHHVLLAPLKPDEQKRWLERASAERLSVADLRLELRALRSAAGKTELSAGAKAGSEATVCPHCGHHLGPSTD